MISYNTKLLGSQEDLAGLRQILEWQRLVFNIASKEQFGKKTIGIVPLHAKVYHPTRRIHPEIPSQIIIRAEQECLSSYRTVKSNKHQVSKPLEKNRLSTRLDKHLFSKSKKTQFGIRITTPTGRKEFNPIIYPKLQALLEKYPYCDPLIYEDAGNLYISYTFDNAPKEKPRQKLCLGVDLGIRIAAACSDGRLIKDYRFSNRKRHIRYLKRSLQSKGTKSARKHLRKIRDREQNQNRNQSHLLINEILKTSADTIALENLKGIKAKKHRHQNKNSISQVPLAELRRILTYKADNAGKSVVLVNPAYSSQTDSLSGKREGTRAGRRFYTKNGLVLDADLNAARNIGQRSKLPVSYGNILDGQALITVPNACKLHFPLMEKGLASPGIYSG